MVSLFPFLFALACGLALWAALTGLFLKRRQNALENRLEWLESRVERLRADDLRRANEAIINTLARGDGER